MTKRPRYFVLWSIIGYGLVGFVVYLSLTPQPPIELSFSFGDKIGHFAAYAVMMGWFVCLHQTSWIRLAHTAGLIALGVGLEFVQSTTAYRSFEVADMVADSVGVALGWLAILPFFPNPLIWADELLRSAELRFQATRD